MPHDGDPTSFGRWQQAQRRLHELERQILDAAREHGSGRRPRAPDGLVARAHEMRLEVDALFPAAMKDLEDQVRTLKSRRPRPGEL